MEIGSLMEVGSIAECNNFDLHYRYSVLKTNFDVLFEWPLKTCLLYYTCILVVMGTVHNRPGSC